MTENVATENVATEAVPFADEVISLFVGKKGYVPKFFAELLPKFNSLLALRSEYKAISGGVEAAQIAAIDNLTEESNPEMWQVLEACAQAEELARDLNAQLKAWAASEVAESSADPEDIKEKFAGIRSDFDKKVAGAADFFLRNEDIAETDDGSFTADSDEGALYLALLQAPKMGRGKASNKPTSSKGKFVREYCKANAIVGPEGQELGTHGVLPQWAVDAYDSREVK